MFAVLARGTHFTINAIYYDWLRAPSDNIVIGEHFNWRHCWR